MFIMRYSKEDEKNKLISKYEPKDKDDSKDISQVIEFLVNNMGSLLDLTRETPFYKNLNKILRIAFGKDEQKFKEMCLKILEHGVKHDLSEQTAAIEQALINLRNMVDGNIGTVLPHLNSLDKDESNFQKSVNSIVNEHYNRIQDGLKNARYEEMGAMLYQKCLEDGKAIRQGKRLNIQEQEGYKFLKSQLT